jgi:hypothetical protein
MNAVGDIPILASSLFSSMNFIGFTRNVLAYTDGTPRSVPDPK